MNDKYKSDPILTRHLNAANKAYEEEDWQNAVEQYSKALTRPDLPIAIRRELLQRRASCYRELNSFEAQSVDLEILVGLHRDELIQAEEIIDQREAELAVLSSILRSLAAEMNIGEVYEIVGEKIREIFDAQVVIIGTYNQSKTQAIIHYLWEKGQRYYPPPANISGIMRYLMDEKKTLLINQDFASRSEKIGVTVSEGERPKSAVFIPLMLGNDVFGGLSLQNIDREFAFSENDVRMLETLASSMSVALVNVRLLNETAQRNAELQIINSVQQGLASKLDMSGIYELVGEKVREIFEAQVVTIFSLDLTKEISHYEFVFEKGQRFYPEPRPFNPIIKHVIMTQEPFMINENLDQHFREIGFPDYTVPGTEAPKAVLLVPFIVDGLVKGGITLQNVDRENVFDEADVRLLETLANSMSIALENARLFDETQRLLEDSQQRNAELTIVNTIGQGLASKLDYQAIIDLVGDKVSEIFNADTTYIALYDAKTNTGTVPYYVERGYRHEVQTRPLGEGFWSKIIQTQQPILFGTMAEQDSGIPQASPGVDRDLNESYLGVPILVGNDVIGVVSVQNYQQHAFDEADQRLLTTIASNMGVALENARLFDETNHLLEESRQRTVELETINAVSQAMASELELGVLIELIGDEINKIFKPDISYVALLDRQTNLIEFPFSFGEETRPLKYGEGLTSQIIQTREPLLVNRDEAWKQAEKDVKRVGIRSKSFLGVPILAGREAIGAISVQSTEKAGRFNESDMRLLSTIAASVGAAIRNAQLYQETQQRAGEMATLAEIGNDIASTHDMEPVLERIAARAMELLNVQDIALSLIEPDGETLRSVVVLGEYVDEIKSFELKVGEGIIGDIARSGIAEFVNYPNEDKRKITISGTPEVEVDPEGLMAAPLISAGEVIGLITVWRKHKFGLFNQRELDFLVSVARQAAIAIESARLYIETERRAEEMAALAEVGREVSETLDLKTVLNRMTISARNLLNSQASAIFLLQSDGITLKPITAVGDLAEHLMAFELCVGEGIIGDIVARGVPEYVYDTASDPRGVHINGTSETEEGEKLMVAPLHVREQTIGAMAVWREAGQETFTQSDLNFLSGLSRQAAYAIENARLFDAVQHQKEYFEALFVNNPAAVLTIDLDQAVVSWSPAAERLFGYTAEEVIGHKLDDFVANTPEIHEEATAFTQKLFEENRIQAISKRTRKDGTLVDVDMLAMPVDVDGQRVGYIGIYHDITELEAARRAAEEANQAKSTFLANMSHELRTPLNAIIGFTRIVKRKAKDALPEKQLENLDKVLISAEHLLGLINSILDIAKIEAGRMDVQPGTFEIEPLIDLCVTTTQPLVKQEEVLIVKEIQSKLPPIYSDQDKVKQILLNLLSNAAKFTHQGQITIKACRQKNEINIDVQDTGIGISKEKQATIFEEFQQEDTSTSREYGGTGLGLSISRRLANLLGGDIFVSSKQGVGSTFTLKLPYHYDGQLPPETQTQLEDRLSPSVNTGKPIVLVIDDNPDISYLLAENLESAGYQIVAALSGDEGIMKAKQLKPFSIMLDIMMPKKDGWQVLHELKADPETRQIPVIILSIVDKKALGYRLGAVDYLVKPLDENSVLEVLKRLAIDNEGVAPKRILVVDDDPDVYSMVCEMLENTNYSLDCAQDGQQALKLIEENPPDAILLDLLMPKLDGFGVIEQLRVSNKTWDIPVIVLTAKLLTNEEEKELRKSVSQVIEKKGLAGEQLIYEIDRAINKES